MENKLYSMLSGFKRARMRKKLKQSDVADAMGVHIKTVMNWEQGLSNPDLETLMKLAELFDCDLDYLVGRIEAPKHDIQTIHDMTGLSVNAIEKICSEKAPANETPVTRPMVRGLSHLIEADGFQEFVDAFNTFEVAATVLGESEIPQVKPYPVDENGEMIIDGLTGSDDGAYDVIGHNKMTLRIDNGVRFTMWELSQALMRLCEPYFKENYEMCMKNSKRNEGGKNNGQH